MASESISSKVHSIFCPLACLLFHALFSMQNSASANHDSLSKTDWQQIQMVPLEERDELCQLCSGMYVDPEKEARRKNKFDPQLIEANAHKAELTNEKLTLSGGFEASQENQTLSGDKAELSREKSTINIEGNVAIREPGLLLRGERATMQTQNKQIELSNATYTLHDQHIYGSAEALRRNDQGIVEIENGGFSYCSPIGNPSWYIETNSMELNPKSGVGKARGSILRVGGLPIAYLPWIEFPIGDKRRTGFLWPEIHTGPRGGLDLTFPIYLNLAPNYDLTYSPRYIQERGLNQHLSGRYLDQRLGYWEASGGFLNSDNVYEEENPSVEDADRWLMKIKHLREVNSKWSSRINFSKVSDADYLKDLDNLGVNSRRATSLRQSGSLHFVNDYWSADLKLLQFQSLSYGISQKYKTLPKITGRLIQKENLFSFNPILMLQYANFDSDQEVIKGQRKYGEIGFSFPMRWKFGFLNSTIKHRAVSYSLENNLLLDSYNPSSNSPLITIDAGIFAERETSFFGQKLYQTLEPRFYYLFSKHADQKDQPIFDTSPLTFDFQQLYRSKQITGYDRFQEANQLSVGLTTRYISQKNADEYLNTSLGKIFYFAGKENYFSDSLASFQNSKSDFFFQVNFFPKRTFSLNGDLQYNPKNRNIRRGNISLRYSSKDGKIFNLEHSHRKIEKLYFEKIKIDETRISTYFPIGSKWRVMSAWSYNWDLKSSMEDLFGIEYDSCCWKARLIYSRYLDRVPGQGLMSLPHSGLDREESVQIQILLKGMGSLGPRVDKLMSSMIKGLNFGET